ncbi:hypothetical protein ANCCEY_03214 [Ancylostoma ceylanicum]|uniref:CRAL/TRIO N-terminal domain-containing protein n=1 Tax=Ancylostoma ceylanicum TaxID=53326 RepID=A0A0D6M083_9BILA|nr:hypothetical protein ANCCEY_03214 [Ancylostoma ceylanicum]
MHAALSPTRPISAEEQQAIVDLRTILPSIECLEDSYILRWLRAKDLRFDETAEALKKHVTFRKAWELDTIDSWVAPEKIPAIFMEHFRESTISHQTSGEFFVETVAVSVFPRRSMPRGDTFQAPATLNQLLTSLNDPSQTSFFEQPELMCVLFTVQQENDVNPINNSFQAQLLYFVAGENKDPAIQNRSIHGFPGFSPGMRPPRLSDRAGGR